MFNQPDPPACRTDKIRPSPNGRYLAIQYNCHDKQFTRLLHLDEPPALSVDLTAVPPSALTDFLLPRGYFLSWSPDGHQFLFRNTDTDQVSLWAADGSLQTPLVTLPVGTYGATFTPDGHWLTIVSSRGLGLGSEMGTLNLQDNSYSQQHLFPHQIVAYPTWSPDGTQLVYVLMADSNTPFTVGELWLADTATGEPVTLLGRADAGHGYSPVWLPDSSAITYVYRENPDSVQANQITHKLHSNIYQVNVTTGVITPLTQFQETLVYDPVWSPDGRRLLFTAQDAIWLFDTNRGESPIRVSQAGPSRHPAWLVAPTP